MQELLACKGTYRSFKIFSQSVYMLVQKLCVKYTNCPSSITKAACPELVAESVAAELLSLM